MDKRPRKAAAHGADAAGARQGGKDAPKMKHGGTAERPGWSSGLRQLYDSVVDEPLPDSFNDLLAKLDRPN